MENFSNCLHQDLLLPFLDIRSLLTLSCVSTRYRLLIQDHCFSESGYFRTVCQRLCSHDRATFAGLLTGGSTRDDPPPTLLIRQRLDLGVRNWLYEQKPWLDQDNQEDGILLETCQIFSWKKLCLKLLNRIETIERRSLQVVLPPQEPQHPGLWNSIVSLASQSTKEPVKIKVLIVGGTAHQVQDTFYGICYGNGISDTDTTRWGHEFFSRPAHKVKLSWPATIETLPVDWLLHSMHYGPAGDEPQEGYCFMPHVTLSILCCPHVLVWTIPLRTLKRQTSTPYHYPTYAMANRFCLRDFILAEDCPCRILVVLITVDGMDHDWDQNACCQDAAERLRLDSLTPLGIAWHVAIGHVSRRRRNPNLNATFPFLEGFTDALRWAWSKLES